MVIFDNPATVPAPTARFSGIPLTVTTVEVSRLFIPGALLEVEVLAIT